jgi:hypothetical protein
MALADLCEKPIEVEPAVESVVNWVFYMLIKNFFVNFNSCHRAVFLKLLVHGIIFS